MPDCACRRCVRPRRVEFVTYRVTVAELRALIRELYGELSIGAGDADFGEDGEK